MQIRYDDAIQDFIVSAGQLVRVKAVTAKDDHTLVLTFSTGEIKVFDFKPLLDLRVYEPLKNLALFKMAYVEGGTVAWSDEIDIAPEGLYSDSVSLPV